MSLLTYFCVAYFLLLTIHLHAKFEAYSFSCFKFVHRGPQIKSEAT